MRRWLFMCMLILVMVTSACSSGSENTGGHNTEEPSTSSQDAGSGKVDSPSGQQSEGPKVEIDGIDVTALYEAAKNDGQLMYYGGAYPVDQTDAYVAEFKKRFPGIEVEVFRAPTPAVLERFLSEVRAGKYIADVIFQGDPYTLKEQISEGYLKHFDFPFKEKYPSNLLSDEYVFPHAVVYLGPIYNSNIVSGEDEEALRKDWKFVTDPKWKEKLAITVPEAGGTSYGPVYMFLGEEADQFGEDFIKGLQPNIGQYFTSTVPATAQVAAGEFAIHVHGQTAAAGGLLEKGAPIRIAFPAPTPAVPVGAAITAEAPHPNAAELFMLWAFSIEGQEKMVEIAKSHSANEEVTLDPFSEYDWYQKPDPSSIWIPESLNNYLQGLTDISAKWHDIMGTKN